MSVSQEHQPTLDSVAPRFLVGDMEQALAFYGQLGFATPYHDEGFAIIERDGIALQFNVSDPTQEPPKEGCRVECPLTTRPHPKSTSCILKVSHFKFGGRHIPKAGMEPLGVIH